ncbi:MAG: hypothetical protein K2O34_08785 [Acetatifactor sp.]|nr:hypothetical protein [Acetatifactor sp.]
MAMEITGNYSSYAAQSMAMAGSGAVDSTKRKETAGSSTTKSAEEYMNELAKLAPSVDFRVGNGFSAAKTGKTLTINPQLLKKMQNDPEKEKEMKELIRGVESAVNMMDSINKASGWTVVFKHSYIDENGEYRSIALIRNDFMLNMSKELREERRKNAEKLLEKQKEKAAEKKEELREKLEEKMAASQNGQIYLNEKDLEELMEAAKEEHTGKSDKKEQITVGANLDLQV